MERIVQASTQLFQNSGQEVVRKSANYHPSIWGDHFLAYDSNITEMDSHEIKEHERVKQNLITMLNTSQEKSVEKLELIDAMQRLGVCYHFDKDIKLSLQRMYDEYQECFQQDGYDLYTVALRFRLLRQQGHHVPCDVFNKFINSEGKWDESLKSMSNIKGMFSLYEASHYRVRGENILEEAVSLTITHLESIVVSLDFNNSFLKSQLSLALKLPIRNTVTRLGARTFISLYQQDHERINRLLLNFAIMDFNILQEMHQKELSDITRWWKGLDFAKKLPFARDRVVECYFWILALYFEPQYCSARRLVTKVISMTSIMDDIYDVYGTLDELTLLTHAIQRWDIAEANQLPSYMQLFYHALLNVYTEMEQEFTNVNFAKDQMKKLARAYFQEAKWCHNGYIPTYEEYMNVALVTSAYSMLATTGFVCMGSIATKNSFNWLLDEPLILKASQIICRLSDDLVGHQFEQERDHVASAIECYMNQYGDTKEETYSKFRKQIQNAWKDINQEFLHTIGVPIHLLMIIVNLTRVIHLAYKDEDWYTNSKIELKEFISSVLVHPITIDQS